MTEVVAAGQDQVQEPVLTEIELDASSVGNMIILLKTIPFTNRRRIRATNTTNV